MVGDDLVFMLTGPIPASKLALKIADLRIDHMDIFAVIEAFVPVLLAWSI